MKLFKALSIGLLLTTSGWGDITSVGTFAAGSNGQVQYNDRNDFGASSNLTYSTTTLVLSAPIMSMSSITINGVAYTWPNASCTSGYTLNIGASNSIVCTAPVSPVGGGGASSLAVNLDGVQITSPTVAINAVSPLIVTSVGGGTTAQISVDVSSFTLNGPLSASAPLLLTGGAFSLDKSSVTLRGPDPALGGALSGTISNAVLGLVDISAKTNLAVNAPITLTGDIVGIDKSSVTLLGPSIDASELPADGYASTYVNAAGDTMTGQLTVSGSSITATGAGGIRATYGISGGSLTARNLASTLVAVDANGVLISTSVVIPAAGAAMLGISSGSATNSVVVSSPTSNVVFDSNTISVALQGATSSFIQVKGSSVTLHGENIILLGSTPQGAGSVFNVSSGTANNLNATTMTVTQDLSVGDDATISGGLSVLGGSGISALAATIGGQSVCLEDGTDCPVSAGGGGGAGVIAGTGNLYDVPYVSVASSNTLSMSSNIKVFPSSVTILGAVPLLSTSTLTLGTTIYASSGTIINFSASSATISSATIPAIYNHVNLQNGKGFYFWNPTNTEGFSLSNTGTTNTGVLNIAVKDLGIGVPSSSAGGQGVVLSTLTVQSSATVQGQLQVSASGIRYADGTIQTSSPTAGGGGTPSGTGTQLQYRDGSSFGGVPGSTVTVTGIVLGSATVSGQLTAGTFIANSGGFANAFDESNFYMGNAGHFEMTNGPEDFSTPIVELSGPTTGFLDIDGGGQGPAGIRLWQTGIDKYVAIQSTPSGQTSYSMVLPSAPGTAGQNLQVSNVVGSSVSLAFVTQSAGSGSGVVVPSTFTWPSITVSTITVSSQTVTGQLISGSQIIMEDAGLTAWTGYAKSQCSSPIFSMRTGTQFQLGDATGDCGTASQIVIQDDPTNSMTILPGSMSITDGTNTNYVTSQIIQNNTGLIIFNRAHISSNTILGAATFYADGTILGAKIGVSNLNGGSGATSSTFWRGDGTWNTPAGGSGGAAALGVGMGGPTGYSIQTSSPTTDIMVDSNTMTATLQGSATTLFTLKGSSVTLRGTAWGFTLDTATGTLTTNISNLQSSMTAVAVATTTLNTSIVNLTSSMTAVAVSTTAIVTRANLTAAATTQVAIDTTTIGGKFPVDLSGANATGTMAAGRFPALTGPVTTTAGSLATTVNLISLSTGVTGSLAAASIATGKLGASVLASSITMPSLTGDVTTTGGGVATTLASIVTANQYGSASVVPVITFDAKGRITAVSSATISASGGGYALEPATVTIQGNKGVTASTMTVYTITVSTNALVVMSTNNLTAFRVDNSSITAGDFMLTVSSVPTNGTVPSGQILHAVDTYGISYIYSYTKAQIATLVPAKTYGIVGCTDCTALTICVSTGTIAGSWSSPTAKTTACN